MATAPTDEIWPPRSARQALLSSPSGKRKFADFQAGKIASSSMDSSGPSSLLDQMRLARQSHDKVMDDNNEDEDDEETLQLKLAAIEAKLKLKKLQNKAKKEVSKSEPRPASSSGGSRAHYGTSSSHINVVLSPIKRPNNYVEQKSPSRVVLGIDKGVRGADISLHRAKAISSSPSKDRSRTLPVSSVQSTSRILGGQHSGKVKGARVAEIKSFSERMAQVRDHERTQAERRDDVAKARSKHFNLNAAEIENFKADAGIVAPHSASLQSPTRTRPDTASHAPDPTSRSRVLEDTRTVLGSRDADSQYSGDPTLFEGFSGLHLSSRILPHSFLKRTLPSDEFTTYSIPDLLKAVTSPAYELPDGVGNYVVFAVVASKSTPLDQKNSAGDKIKSSNSWDSKWEDGSQNRRKFMVMALTDLKWTIDLYLFETALPRYHRLSPGTVVAILNPSIMPPKKGREDTGAFSLALHDGDDTVLEIGTSKDLAFCNVIKRDGKQCGQWVNRSKSEICEWHLNAQIAKTQSGRMGVNTGANGFGGTEAHGRGSRHGPYLPENGYGSGSLQAKQRRGYDRFTDSQFYIIPSSAGAKSTPTYNPDISTVNMLDADDDPFIAEGQISRDKEAWLKKRLAKQEKERDIAKQLGNLGNGNSAGADYMRRTARGETSSLRTGKNVIASKLVLPPTSSFRVGDTATSTAHATQPLASEIGRKRKGADVRLSPMKKTRFVTDQGIEVTGRESIVMDHSHPTLSARPRPGPGLEDKDDDDDDDDDLDII